jgi:kynurenine 3-monooxygenase
MSEPAPVITICGAGPVGSLLAILLARQGWRIDLVERRADPRRMAAERGRSINLALAARGLEALRAAGLLEVVQPELVVMRGRQLHEADGGERFLPYGQRPDEVIYAIERARLNNVLIAAAAAEPGVTMRFGQRCLDVDLQAGTARWRYDTDGSERASAFELMIGTDGAGSAVRHALEARGYVLASEEPLAHDYRELVIPPLPGGLHALEPHALHIWPRGGYMLIALPNPDGSFTATLFLPRTGAAASAGATSEPSFAAIADAPAARAFFAAQFPDALELIPDFDAQFASHPQSRLATLRCWPWHRGRVLLVGDAAHAIVPFHGQGLNCGFEDCVQLARQLGPAAGFATGDAPTAFAAVASAFERQRRPNTDAIAQMAIENYEDMRARVLAPDFVARRTLDAALERRFPGRYVPRYAMVMFHPEIPYADALRRGAMQESLLDALLARCAAAVPGRSAADIPEAELLALAAGDEAAHLLGEAGL